MSDDNESPLPDAKFPCDKVLLIGNPVDGFHVVGPFEDAEDAARAAVNEGHDEWWIHNLEPPEVDDSEHRDAASDEPQKPFVVVCGSFAGGFTFIGPLQGADGANQYGESLVFENHWSVAELTQLETTTEPG
jgi:hypothetical protein